MRDVRRRNGLVMPLVMVFALLLASSVATFARRSVVDSAISRQRNAASQAEALGRGAVQLAIALLLEDKLREHEAGFSAETLEDPWARVGELEIEEADARLRLRIHDTGARLNLNSLLDEQGKASENTEIFAVQLLEKAIADIPSTADEKNYDTGALARALIDYMDADQSSPRGDLEDDYYQKQDPPYRAANRALLSVAELGLIQGFDRRLVEALEPYVTVFPYAGGTGINPNTAPPHVLALLYSQDALDTAGSRLPTAATVKDLVDARRDGQLFCGEASNETSGGVACTGLGDFIEGQIFPAPTFASDVFLVDAEVEVGDVRRTVSAVLDRGEPQEPRLLSWRVH